MSLETIPLPPEPARIGGPRNTRWEHARNSLGIARLLVHDDRPEALLATACQSAVENACRAALDHSGLPFDGDLPRALSYLSAPEHLLQDLELALGAERLRAAESAVAWLAGYLRAEAPEKAWGF